MCLVGNLIGLLQLYRPCYTSSSPPGPPFQVYLSQLCLPGYHSAQLCKLRTRLELPTRPLLPQRYQETPPGSALAPAFLHLKPGRPDSLKPHLMPSL